MFTRKEYVLRRKASIHKDIEAWKARIDRLRKDKEEVAQRLDDDLSRIKEVDGELELHPISGGHINDWAYIACIAAREADRTVYLVFNGTKVAVPPTYDAESVVFDWMDQRNVRQAR